MNVFPRVSMETIYSQAKMLTNFELMNCGHNNQ